MTPHGAALLAYLEGDRAAELIIRRDDGQEGRLPVAHFFREPAAFTPVEKAALERCRGRVLDVGAGTGLHSLALQERGLRVTAIDISAAAVEVMARRGVVDVHRADIFEHRGGPFDTVLLLGHGIGMVETPEGLDRFLAHARGWLAEGGQVLVDSLDVRVTGDPRNLEYQEANRRAGRSAGEIRIGFEFRGVRGPLCGWLHVDPGTLRTHAARAGWACDVVLEEPGGDYLALVTA
ncbi:MAG: methyltransferase domain-containing protein [Planctomycetes bacterium]|nr:methyltransferase domain-containing protein [Planctomycetota bacterium]